MNPIFFQRLLASSQSPFEMKKKKRRTKAMAAPTSTSSSTSTSSRRRRHRSRGRKVDRLVVPSPAEWRDWAALPGNVVLAILSRLQADVQHGSGAGLVCASWRQVAMDPLLWTHIDLAVANDDRHHPAPAGWQAMARAAVDRSAGRCESFRGRVDNEFLIYLADRAPSLRSLHVTSSFYMTDKKFVSGVAKKLPLLEKLVLSSGSFSRSQMAAVIDHCPRLELLDAGGCRISSAIGKRMVARWQSTIKELRMPKRQVGCLCCMTYSQRYADAHDE